MKRKVLRLAGFSHAITLPREWILKHDIKKGDELDAEELSSSLLISKSNSSKLVKEIDVSGLDPLVKRYIIKLYQAGFDELKINFDNPELIKKVQEVINEQLIGYEIVHHASNSCTVKDISGSSTQEFSTIFKRIFLLLLTTLEDGQKALQNNDLPVLKSMHYRDLEINRLSNFCIRQLNKNVLRHKPSDFLKIYQCEQVGDQYKAFVESIIGKGKAASKELISLHNGVTELFRKIYEFNLGNERKKALEIALHLEKLKSKCNAAFSSLDKTEMAALHHLLRCINVIATIGEVDIGLINDS